MPAHAVVCYVLRYVVEQTLINGSLTHMTMSSACQAMHPTSSEAVEHQEKRRAGRE